MRVACRVGVGVELGEELLDRCHAQGEHRRLVAVVARAHVAGAHGASHRHLRHFLAVAEDAELGLAGEHFLAADEAHLAAAVGPAVIAGDRGG
jgi:hypothetical protein